MGLPKDIEWRHEQIRPRARVRQRGEGSWLEARIVARDTIAGHQLRVRHLAGPGFDPLLKIHPDIFRIPSWCRPIPARVLNSARWPKHSESLSWPEKEVRKGFVNPEEYQAILCHLPDYLRTGDSDFIHHRLAYQRSALSAVASRGLQRRVDQAKAWRNEEWPGAGVSSHPPSCAMSCRLTANASVRPFRIVPWLFHSNGEQLRSLRKAWKRSFRDVRCPGLIVHDLRRNAVRNP